MTSSPTLKTMLNDFRLTFKDNPLIEKDAGLVLRKGSYVALLMVLGAAMVSIFALAVLSAESTSRDLLYWSSPKLFGAVGLSTIVVIVAVTSSVVFPIYASASIAGEKERGTFPLLVTSSLTPGQIVVGKFIALMLSVAPVIFLAAPFLAFSAFGGEVTPVVALLSVGYLVVGSALQIAVGLWTSSLVDRVRFAGPLSIAASGLLVWPIFTFPLFGGLAAWSEHAEWALMGPGMIFVVASSLCITAVCLLATRSRLAPKALPRAKARAFVTSIIQIGLPILAAASYCMVLGVSTSELRDFVEAYGHLLPLLYGLVLFISVILDVSHSANRREELSDAPSPRRAVVVTGIRIGFGLLCATAIVTLAGSQLTASKTYGFEMGSLFFDGLAASAILTLGFMGLASLVVLVGSIIKTPALKMLIAGSLALVMLVFPFMVAIVSDIVTGSEWFPMLWMNPLHQITAATGFDFWDSSKLTRQTFFGVNAAVPGVLAFLTATTIAIVTGGQRNDAPIYRR